MSAVPPPFEGMPPLDLSNVTAEQAGEHIAKLDDEKVAEIVDEIERARADAKSGREFLIAVLTTAGLVLKALA